MIPFTAWLRDCTGFGENSRLPVLIERSSKCRHVSAFPKSADKRHEWTSPDWGSKRFLPFQCITKLWRRTLVVVLAYVFIHFQAEKCARRTTPFKPQEVKKLFSANSESCMNSKGTGRKQVNGSKRFLQTNHLTKSMKCIRSAKNFWAGRHSLQDPCASLYRKSGLCKDLFDPAM